MPSCSAAAEAAEAAPPSLSFLLVGATRTGKSSSGNTLLGRGRVFDTRGGGPNAVVGGVSAGRHVTVVDARGWSPEASRPREEKVELLEALSLFGFGGPHVVLLVIPLLDFTEPERRVVEERMEVLGTMVWRHTMVLFTCGDRLRKRGLSVQQHIQAGGRPLQWLMGKCRYRYHVFDNRTAGGGGMEEESEQVRGLLGKAEDLLQENGGWHYSLHMYQRLEEEWSRRETELRARLRRERRRGRASEEEGEDEWEEEEEDGVHVPENGTGPKVRCTVEEGRVQPGRSGQSSEDEGWDTCSDSGGEREEVRRARTEQREYQKRRTQSPKRLETDHPGGQIWSVDASGQTLM